MGDPMMNAHVYLVTNNINGKQYVGQTTVMRNKVGHGKAISESYKKYGKENFSYEPICKNIINRNTLNFIEKFWIKVMDSQVPNGYNIEAGGTNKGEVSESTKQKLRNLNLGKVISEETKIKISNSLKGEKNPFFGKKHSKESIEKISLSNIGKVVVITEEQKKKISIANSSQRNGMYGRPITDEHRAKLRANSARNKPWLGKKFTESHKAHLTLEKICPHCKKIGKGNAMVRWHLDNCKKKENT
jgi:group I intron endonuclease